MRRRPGRFSRTWSQAGGDCVGTERLAPANPWAYGDVIREEEALQPPPDGRQQAFAQPYTPAQAAQRCNTGRLLGGLMEGGAGYALSRQDGRAWAIPLGALLGSQMGCSMVVGRGPLPW